MNPRIIIIVARVLFLFFAFRDRIPSAQFWLIKIPVRRSTRKATVSLSKDWRFDILNLWYKIQTDEYHLRVYIKGIATVLLQLWINSLINIQHIERYLSVAVSHLQTSRRNPEKRHMIVLNLVLLEVQSIITLSPSKIIIHLFPIPSSMKPSTSFHHF